MQKSITDIHEECLDLTLFDSSFPLKRQNLPQGAWTTSGTLLTPCNQHLCLRPLGFQKVAFWYYSSIFCKWWDFGGMSSFYTEIGGIHPTGDHPKPRPTTPRNLLIIMIFLYQSQNSYLHVESKS